MILYFTGTGNSSFVANQLAELTDDSLISMNEKIKKNESLHLQEEHTLVFVTPTYAWKIPRLVEKWILENDFGKSTKVYFVMSCGDSIGNAEKYLKKLCVKKDFLYMGTAEIIMPENYIALYDAPGIETSRKIVEKSIPIIKELAIQIKNSKRLPIKKLGILDKINSSIVNVLFYPIFVKADLFKVTEKCISCGKCEKECPLNNIHLSGDKPIWGHNCTHCMACICKCPVEAIEYGKHSAKKVRYQCPM